MKMKPLPLVLAVSLLAGCSLAPDYFRPNVEKVNAQWQDGSSDSALSAAQIGWRDVFQDPALQQVVDLGLANNKDLQLALLNVQLYQAQYRIQRADLLPDITAGVDQQSTRTTNDDGKNYERQYSATVGLTSYELDLFGRIRSLKQQALEQYLAEQETQRSTAITIVSNIANAYLDLVSDSALEKLSEQNLKIEEDNHKLVKQRHEIGVASDLELAQADSSLEDARVTLSNYRRVIKLDRNALALLIGQPLPSDWKPAENLKDVKLADVQAGMSSDLINQRPDILAAEHTLKAQNASIGAARAAFFPTISLTASGGLASGNLSDVFSSDREYWSFSPSIRLPIFNGGRLRAQLDSAKVETKIALVTYQQTVQNAFSEVSDALNNRDGYAVQLQNQINAEKAHTRYYRLADQRYRTGVDDMLTRLTAQQNLVSSQESTIVTRLSLLQSKVDLYRALGGGWQANTDGDAIKDTASKAVDPGKNLDSKSAKKASNKL